MCHWSTDGKCIDGEEDHYTEENCFAESAFGKVWVDGKCRTCTKAYGIVLSVAILSMVLFWCDFIK